MSSRLYNNEKVNECGSSNLDSGSFSPGVGVSQDQNSTPKKALPVTNSCASGLRLLFGMASFSDLSSVDTTYSSANARPRAPRLPREPSCASGIRFLRGEFRSSLASSVSSDFSLSLSVNDFVLQSLKINSSRRNSDALAGHECQIPTIQHKAGAVTGARSLDRRARMPSKPSCASGIRLLAGDFTSFASTVSSGAHPSMNDLVTNSRTRNHNHATSRRRSTGDGTRPRAPPQRSASLENRHVNADWDEFDVRPITKNMFLDKMHL
ncbi:hypothetical protein ACHAXS_002661 [Conticribra weissflogii]